MKIRLLALLFSMVSPCVIAENGDRAQAIESATQATVLIKTHLKHGFLEDDEAEGRWEGSGFLFNKEKGWILTNAHVAGFGPVSLRLKFEGQEKFTSVERLFVDSKHDVAVIRSR